MLTIANNIFIIKIIINKLKLGNLLLFSNNFLPTLCKIIQGRKAREDTTPKLGMKEGNESARTDV